MHILIFILSVFVITNAYTQNLKYNYKLCDTEIQHGHVNNLNDGYTYHYINNDSIIFDIDIVEHCNFSPEFKLVELKRNGLIINLEDTSNGDIAMCDCKHNIEIKLAANTIDIDDFKIIFNDTIIEEIDNQNSFRYKYPSKLFERDNKGNIVRIVYYDDSIIYIESYYSKGKLVKEIFYSMDIGCCPIEVLVGKGE